MALWLLSVTLAFLIPAVVITILIVICYNSGLGMDWLAERMSLRRAPEADPTALDTLDKEIGELTERIAEQERTAGAGTWLTRAVVWRNRKRLAELEHHRAKL